MRPNDNPREYPRMIPLEPVPDVHDDDIEAADEIVQEFLLAVDFSNEDDDSSPRLAYQSPPPSPAEEQESHEMFRNVQPERVQPIAAENSGPRRPSSPEAHDEDALISALDAHEEEEEGPQRAVQASPLYDHDDDGDILALRMLEIDPQPSHSRDLVSPHSEYEGKVLVANSPLSPFQSEYGSPPHLSPYWSYDLRPPCSSPPWPSRIENNGLVPYLCPSPMPGPSRIMIVDEVVQENGPMEPEVSLETLPQLVAEPLPSTSRGSRGIWTTGLALGVDGSGRMTGLNIDFNREVTEPAEDPGKGQSRKRNINSSSNSASSALNSSQYQSYLKKADSTDVRPKHELKKCKRESRSTEKKRSCNSEPPRDGNRKEEAADEEKVENIDNPIRPTYGGGAGNYAKKFPSIPGVMEWFAQNKREHELELDNDAEDLVDLKYETWESTRSKCKARRENLQVEAKGDNLEQSMDLEDGSSDDEELDDEEVEEEEEEEEEEDSAPRRGRYWPRKMN